jgi:hypothetical protein
MALSNLATNFDPNDPDLGGKLIPDGTSRVGEIVKMLDEVLSVGSASFGRITGSSPTPAGLQGFQSDASTGSTSYNEDSSGYDSGTVDGVYFSNDPALDSGDTAACFMLSSWKYCHFLVIADPPTNGVSGWNSKKNPSNFVFRSNYYQNQRAWQHKEDTKDKNERPGGGFFSRLQQTGTDYPGSNNYLQISHRIYVFCSDDHLVWRTVLDAERDRVSGVGMIWLDKEPDDGHYSRDEVPAIHTRSFRRFPAGRINSPAHSNNGKAVKTSVQDELGFVPGNSDVQGREMIFNQHYYINNPLPAHKGKIPALKVVRDDAIALWDTVVIDGDNWVCFHRDSGRGYLTRYENSK